MTPDELRALADEATPGPWRTAVAGRWLTLHDQPWHRDRGAFDAAVKRTPTDARLIALAPDLARLCAELAQALDAVVNGYWGEKIGPPRERADAVLAKLSELKP